MRKLIIKVPQKETNLWSISFNKGIRKRKTATMIFKWARRHLYAYAKRAKIAVEVKYSKDTSNETVPSAEPDYLVYATSCFLEDYLSDAVLAKEVKEWKKFLKK
jgi:hypothetical protein